MDTKKIKKSANTLTGLIVTMLIVIGAFTGMFLFFNQKAVENGMAIDSKYNETYNELQSAQNQIEADRTALQSNLNNVTEASSLYSVAINGMKGIGNAIKTTFHFVETSSLVVNSLIKGMQDVLPDFVKTAILIGIILVVIILIFSIFKGEQGRT